MEFSLPADARLRVCADGSSEHVFATRAQLSLWCRCCCRRFCFGFRSRGFRQMFSTSSRVIRPPTPVPLIALASRLCSPSRRRIAGLRASLFCSARDACWRCAGVESFSSDLALVSLPVLLPSRRRPRIWREVTVVLHLPEPHQEYRPLMPVLPVPLCQFRFLPVLHHDVLHRPVFVPVATVASATDSGRSGTRISTLLIIYPLFNRRSARHLPDLVAASGERTYTLLPERQRPGDLHNAELTQMELLHGNDAGCSTMRPG